VDTKHSGVYAGYSRPFAEDELGLVRRFLIADVYARFLRARGESVLFGLGVESFGEAVELEAARRGTQPPLLVEEHLDRLRRRFDGLRISCDWDRTVVSSDPEHCLKTQSMFLTLLERDLIYRRDPPNGSSSEGAPCWVLRTSRFAEQCELESTPPSGWTTDAMETQREALGRVDGVEIRAVLPGVGDLVVFTPHADAIARAAFVSVSPNHPEVEALVEPDELARIRGETDEMAILQTALQIAVPGIDELLPVVLAPNVDARFGPTAMLGIPDCDETDREMAERLRRSPGMSLGTMRVSSKPSPAVRYRLPDLSITGKRPWGVPVPIVNCGQCGQIPIPTAELPIHPSESAENPQGEDTGPSETALDGRCPQCGKPAQRDASNLDWTFDSMWIWPSICTRLNDEEVSPSSAERTGWRAVNLVVWDASDSDQLLWQRVAGHILNSLGPSDVGEDESFLGAMVHGSLDGEAGEVAIENVDDLDEYIAGADGDVARFAILNAGSPGRSTRLYPHLLQHAERFVSEVREQAKAHGDRKRPVPEEIEPSTRPRRRLAAWSQIAADRVTGHLERLEIHKAAYDVALFEQRIRAFESERLENGGLDEKDRDAIVVALVRLGRIAEPLLPGLAANLESIVASKS
jgi:leucyl-tRNA synthetase